ncbi:MAG: beta-ribofuranosylaminobenzene 5'-phosphate synthase family protein [Caldisphaera sp.]|jgi:beta-ribofuranosylaminobenzene 5'-phosphate synthase|nr:MAG: GHMP kinase [Caldisphaera sp.]PMP92012.1 MAG: GHMP kinase [Caldisphaera sp.]
MIKKLTVSAPSHVHVGNIDLNGNFGRVYGTLGFALETPRLIINMEVSEDTKNTEEIDLYLNLYKQFMNCNKSISAEIISDIPKNVGLGRTTALALSIGYGLNLLCKKSFEIIELAKIANRGNKNSALGVYSFKYGGFIVDGGVKNNEVAPIIFRGIMPENYRAVLALPEKPIKKILEIKRDEDKILSSLPKMDENFVGYLSRLVLMKILPSFSEGDIKSFGEGIMEFNRSLGKYWNKYQEGIYCCNEVNKLIEKFSEIGAVCACQSSWGPTTYGIFNYKEANYALNEIRKAIDKIGGGKVWISKIDNNGAFANIK